LEHGAGGERRRPVRVRKGGGRSGFGETGKGEGKATTQRVPSASTPASARKTKGRRRSPVRFLHIAPASFLGCRGPRWMSAAAVAVRPASGAPARTDMAETRCWPWEARAWHAAAARRSGLPGFCVALLLPSAVLSSPLALLFSLVRNLPAPTTERARASTAAAVPTWTSSRLPPNSANRRRDYVHGLAGIDERPIFFVCALTLG